MATERPKAVVVATVLLFVAFAVGIVLSGERLTHKVAYIPAPNIYCFFAAAFAILAALVYLVQRGHNWARVTCVLLIGIRSAAAISRSYFEFGFLSTASAISLTLVTAKLIAAALLLSKPSNAWFRDSPAQH